MSFVFFVVSLHSSRLFSRINISGSRQVVPLLGLAEKSPVKRLILLILLAQSNCGGRLAHLITKIKGVGRIQILGRFAAGAVSLALLRSGSQGTQVEKAWRREVGWQYNLTRPRHAPP